MLNEEEIYALGKSRKPSLQLIDEIILNVPPQKPFSQQSPFQKSRNMHRVAEVVTGLSGGEEKNFKDYILDKSHFFGSDVRKRVSDGYIITVSYFIFR
jgi:hypothetical protein